MWSAAAAVTCATLGLSGAVAANATTTKTAPATQAASPTGEKPKANLPYPRLDATNVVTGFTGELAETRTTGVIDTPVPDLFPNRSNHYTGSARRGNAWVFDSNNNRWVNLTPVFGNAFLYDIALAPSPSRPLVLTSATALAPITLPNTGDPAGLLRVSVRRADGRILFTDCTVSVVNPAIAGGRSFNEIPLSATNCSTASLLPTS
ncbi:hypothetical protein GCM10027161_35980 [Microbispora hainanensis]